MRNSNILLSFFGAALLAAGCGKNPRSAGIEYAPEMYHALAYEPYRQYDGAPVAFKDGNAMQLPPPGTMARGQWNTFAYGDSAADKERAGRELRNPVASTEEVLAEGEVLFNRYCALCHGKAGKGDGSVPTESKEKFPPPPKYKTRAELPQGRIFHVMTYGQNSMGSYAYALSQEERWKVANWVGKLQDDIHGTAPADTAAAAPAPEPKPDAAKGGKKGKGK